jgi:hypothetical protein
VTDNSHRSSSVSTPRSISFGVLNQAFGSRRRFDSTVMSLSYFKQLIAIALIAAFSGACITFSTSTVSTIDAQKARKFADDFVDDFVKGRQDALYAKMENEFRQITSREKFADLMRTLDERFGKVTSYTFDHDEIGGKLLYNGKTEPTRRIVYQANTTAGIYPLIVNVVPNGNDLAVTDFLFLIEPK